jgi:voltage-gated potassium channel Kch
MLARLCLELGYASRDRMLQDLDSKDLTYWFAVDQVRTIGGDEKILESLAMLTAMVAATAGGKVKAEQFLPWEPDEIAEDPDATLRAMPGGKKASQVVLDEIAELEAWKREQEKAKHGGSRDT